MVISSVQLKEQLQEVDFPITKDSMIQTDWQLQRYAQFIKLMKTHKPKLVVIDSLIGAPVVEPLMRTSPTSPLPSTG